MLHCCELPDQEFMWIENGGVSLLMGIMFKLGEGGNVEISNCGPCLMLVRTVEGYVCFGSIPGGTWVQLFTVVASSDEDAYGVVNSNMGLSEMEPGNSKMDVVADGCFKSIFSALGGLGSVKCGTVGNGDLN
jgi:hypothetical protein